MKLTPSELATFEAQAAAAVDLRDSERPVAGRPQPLSYAALVGERAALFGFRDG